MQSSRRTRIAAIAILAALAWSSGVLYAGCAAACPFGKAAAAHCCRPHGGTPTVRTASCCETLRTAAPETSRAVAPSPAIAFSPAPPVELPGMLIVAAPLAELPLIPPPLYDGIGLYTLHAALLI